MPSPTTGRLVVCATPLGNLGDVSDRMRQTLAAAQLIACEDTRVTRRLLSALDIPAPRLVAYTEERHERVAPELVDELQRGGEVVLVSDAGLPAVSDPGARLVRACHDAGIPVVGIPGPSALPLAIAVSGERATGYRFVGFLPRRAHELDALLRDDGGQATVAYESPRRLAATLARMAATAPERRVVVCRELTKLHEEIRAGTAVELAAAYDGREVRGELTLVIGAGTKQVQADLDERVVRLARAVADAGLGAKAACKVVAAEFGLRARELYDALLD